MGEIVNADLILEALSSDRNIVLSKKLIHSIGLHEAIIYSEMISKHKYFEDRGELNEDGYFFNTAVSLESDTGLSERQQRKVLETLCEKGLIFKKVMGLPAKRCFKINMDIDVITKTLGIDRKWFSETNEKYQLQEAI
jgi:hypothetical protein